MAALTLAIAQVYKQSKKEGTDDGLCRHNTTIFIKKKNVLTNSITKLKYKNTYKTLHILTKCAYEHNDHTIKKSG